MVLRAGPPTGYRPQATGCFRPASTPKRPHQTTHFQQLATGKKSPPGSPADANTCHSLDPGGRGYTLNAERFSIPCPLVPGPCFFKHLQSRYPAAGNNIAHWTTPTADHGLLILASASDRIWSSFRNQRRSIGVSHSGVGIRRLLESQSLPKRKLLSQLTSFQLPAAKGPQNERTNSPGIKHLTKTPGAGPPIWFNERTN